ncbi:class I SAM-dependent DNA methyltransferase [Hoeflea prorocentri]|uniref:Class I SAM-dependent methyltransferase n=1 Tax=Hoeflea prorocentri TaxID=1922333 RepID=A0A9X3UI97_9HYPH|nr:class I SAM-dependent methyltransferase [Hoeflea prorocentri]MCY6379699.1 class I SAM-dependent methyltransferase [Hoeflea prorocentri]MDA5397499.1 class I SAM-dependent methyltransferase [Hoeflea prorocentri]
MAESDGVFEDPLYTDPQFAQLYDANFGPERADFDFCKRLAADAGSVLDLGCGTGALLAALSKGRNLTGVDPASAMLEIARQRPGGERVQWVEADARTVRLERRFDLVLLTGHAFQVFLTREDQLSALETIAHHLSPDGRFIFDTRNPSLKSWKRWTPEDRQQIEHPEHGNVETWNNVSEDPATGIVSYETYYRILRTGRTLSTVSQIVFPQKDVLDELLDAAGLAVEQWYGD